MSIEFMYDTIANLKIHAYLRIWVTETAGWIGSTRSVLCTHQPERGGGVPQHRPNKEAQVRDADPQEGTFGHSGTFGHALQPGLRETVEGEVHGGGGVVAQIDGRGASLAPLVSDGDVRRGRSGCAGTVLVLVEPLNTRGCALGCAAAESGARCVGSRAVVVVVVVRCLMAGAVA
eukprot:9280527-Pyramimonas_sp.AAC.2